MTALNAEVIAIGNSNRQDTEKIQKALGISFDLIPGPNSKLQREYGAFDEFRKHLKPTTVVIDRDGFIRWKYVGSDDEDRPGLSQILSVLRELR